MTAPTASGPSTPAPPAIRVIGDLWRLGADPTAIDGAADEWRRLARRVREVSDDVNKPIDRLVGTEWLGETAETFDQHRRTLLMDVYSEGDLADFAAARLEHAAAALRSAQNLLAESWSRLVARVPASSDRWSGQVTFHPSDDAGTALVHRSVRDAEAVRAELDDILFDDVRGLELIREQWEIIGSALGPVASGGTAPFVLPPEAKGRWWCGTATMSSSTRHRRRQGRGWRQPGDRRAGRCRQRRRDHVPAGNEHRHPHRPGRRRGRGRTGHQSEPDRGRWRR